MSVAVTPAHQRQTLPQRSDINRTWLADAEVHEACQWYADQRGVRLYPYWRDNITVVYNFVRKRAAQGADTLTERQIARDMYPDVGTDYEAYRRKRKSVQRWLLALEQMGLITTSTLRDPRGKILGLRVELRPVSEVAALARGCSSAG